MATGGRISLLIDSPLQKVAFRMRELDPEVKRQIGKATKTDALPIWRESTLEQAQTRLQVRLADSANVGVTAQNVFLRAGGSGTLRPVGTPLHVVAKAIEYGANPTTPVRTRSRSGKQYTRRLGNTFGRPRRAGKVAGPASQSAIRRVASLWVQTTIRTTHEKFEEAARG